MSSDNGRWVAFQSDDLGLDPAFPAGSDNCQPDSTSHLFVRDVVAGTTHRVDVSPSPDLVFEGVSIYGGYDITEDGRYVVFAEFVQPAGAACGSAVVLYAYNTSTGDLTQLNSIDNPPTGIQLSLRPALATGADDVAWEGWQDTASDGWVFNIWLTDLATAVTKPVITPVSGQTCDQTCMPGLNAISGDGSTVAVINCSNLVAFTGPPLSAGACAELFIDPTTGVATELTDANGDPAPAETGWAATYHSISETGRYVVFSDEGDHWGLPTKKAITLLLDRLTGHVTEMPIDLNKEGVYGFGANDQIVLLGVPSPDVNGYEIEVYDVANGTYTPLGLEPDGDYPFLATASLSPNGKYAVYSSLGDYGFATPTPWETYEQNVDGAPSAGLTATSADRQITLAWRKPQAADHVVVRRSVLAKAPTCAHCGRAVATTRRNRVTVGALHNGRRYSFSVFTYTAGGQLISRKTTHAVPHRPRPTVLSIQSRLLGTSMTIYGQLLRASSGQTLARHSIVIFSRANSSQAWTVFARVKTDKYGFWQASVPSHRNRHYRASFAGTKSIAPATTKALTVGA
jgi:hypothetical protein